MSFSSSNKVIAKNTIYLYIRTIVVMMVMLYTSRVVLKVLGVEDLGIYNVVGGIVTLLAFIQGTQAKATSRFITYELGKGSLDSDQRALFSVCMTIHFVIAIIVIVLAETIGLWIVNYATSIPDDRMYAANIVYQFSILTFVVSLIRTPYDAVIIAHERMSVYAYFSILEVILQLGVAVCLLKSTHDNLILFGGLHWLVGLLLFVSYFWYAKRNFHTCRFKWRWDRNKSREILSFSGWTILGSCTNTITQQGVSLLLNNFVGLVANTALGFAQQVNAAVGRFVTSFSTAFNPQMVKLYAKESNVQLFILMNRASKFSFILCYALAFPLIINMDFVLSKWLTEVPHYTIPFCQLILCCSVIDATTGMFNTAISATGNIKVFQIAISCSFLLDILCAFLLLLAGVNPVLVFGSRIITRGILNMVIELYLAKKQLNFNLRSYGKEVLLPIVLTLLLTIPTVYLLSLQFEAWVKLFITTLCSIILCVLCLLFIIMNRGERNIVLSYIYNKIHDRR